MVIPFPKGLFDHSSFQLHASSSVGAILVIAQWGRGAGRIQDSPLHSISGLTQVKFAISVGCEDVEDLIADSSQALDVVAAG